MSLRKPTHDTVGAMDQICYVSLGTTSHFSGNQVAKIEPLTKSVITSPKREIHEENLIIHDIYVGISRKTRVTCCVRITDNTVVNVSSPGHVLRMVMHTNVNATIRDLCLYLAVDTR